MGGALKSRGRGGVRASAPAAAAPALPIVAALCAFAALLAIVVFRGALEYGFSQDDFLGLARASGLAPRLSGPWRVLSHQLFWDAVHASGAQASLAHAWMLGVLAALAALLTWLLARRVSLAAALVGTAWCVTHPSLFTAAYWLAANGDLSATLFALAALGCAFATSRVRWVALPLFALALLCKESALPLPLAIAAVWLTWPAARGARPTPWRDALWWALVALAALFAAALAIGPAHAGLGGAAYALDRSAIVPNLLSYDGWALNRFFATTRGFSDAVDPSVTPWAIALNVAWIAGCFVPALRSRGWLAAGLAYAAMLLPVLPLAHHAYHYYLCAALPAMALLVAALSDALFARVPRAAALPVASLVALVLAVDGAALVTRIEQMPFVLPELRSEPTVDRARIAANALAGLAYAHLPAGSRIALFSPESAALALERGGDPAHESYFEANVRAALLDGLAVRVMRTEIAEARFVRRFEPADTLRLWALYRPDGTLRVVPARELALLFARAAAAR